MWHFSQSGSWKCPVPIVPNALIIIALLLLLSLWWLSPICYIIIITPILLFYQHVCSLELHRLGISDVTEESYTSPRKTKRGENKRLRLIIYCSWDHLEFHRYLQSVPHADKLNLTRLYCLNIVYNGDLTIRRPRPSVGDDHQLVCSCISEEF